MPSNNVDSMLLRSLIDRELLLPDLVGPENQNEIEEEIQLEIDSLMSKVIHLQTSIYFIILK